MSELTPKDKAQLAYLYDLPEYESLKKLLTNERLELATRLLLVPATDTAMIAKMQGQAQALKELALHIKQIHKLEMEKEN